MLRYPSLLESSDLDGSSVAVLTYLRLILETISQPDLIHCVLHYLLAVSERPANKPSSTRPTALARRRKSESLFNQQPDGEKVSPDLFNLLDLVTTSLHSHSQQTISVTLRLLSILLGTQHDYAIMHLLKTTAVHDGSRTRSIDRHDNNIDTLLDIADSLVLDDDLELSYDCYLQDAGIAVESHSCSAQLLALPDEVRLWGTMPTPKNASSQQLQVQPHTLRLDDPLLQSLLSLLDKFLGNDIETNLNLTQTFCCLASCGCTSLEGWLLGHTVQETNGPDQSGSPGQVQEESTLSGQDDTDAKDDQNPSLQSPGKRIGHSEGSAAAISPVFRSLDVLVKQVQYFSQEIEDFDTYLAERRHVFKVGDEIESALNDNPAPSKRSEGSGGASPSRNRSVPQITSISERLMSKDNSVAVSRSSSPRGRQRSEQIAPTLIGRLSHLRISPSPSSSKRASSTHSRSPFRKSSLSSTPPQGLRSPVSPGNALHQKIKIPTSLGQIEHHVPEEKASDASSIRSDSRGPETSGQENVMDINLSHLLTNIIILQEFLLELAAIIEVRASLFGEVTLE